MNVSELGGTTETTAKSIPLVKSTSEIAKLISNEYLKELELKEYCKIVESDFTKLQKKFQDLMSDKNQSSGIKAEYKSRNKTNVTNSESLRKALNELYKYKCELKSSYVTIDKESKLKRQKYRKIIAGYESAWDETLKKYNKTSVIAELLKIQEENLALERLLEQQEQLYDSTKNQFKVLKGNIQQNFSKTVLKFSKFMIQYRKFLTSQKENEKNQSLKAQITRGLDFKLFRTKAPILLEKSPFDDNNDVSSIDLTIFDDVIVPSENLESQHLEEDSFSFLQNDLQQVCDSSKEGLDHQEVEQSKGPKSTTDPKENSMQDKGKTLEENESHYFKQQEKQAQISGENITQKSAESGGEKLKSVTGLVMPQNESEDEVVREVQMECEESLSDGSYEKQYSIQREMYDCQKTSSVSSEELPPSTENPNENDGSVQQGCENEQSKPTKPPCEMETNQLKTFTGFFTMGNDNDNPTPSIFKLF